MNKSSISTDSPARALPAYTIRRSPVHGNGVFARRKLAAGELIIEYEGERIDGDEAIRRAQAIGPEAHHTFLFSLADGKVIDGGSDGNEARWINHACEPNCEAREEQGRIHIYALREIARGEELNYDYALVYDARHTPAVKRAFACRCGAQRCRGTMLAPKRKARRSS